LLERAHFVTLCQAHFVHFVGGASECQAQLGGSIIFGSFGGVFSLFRYPIPPLSALINPINSVFYLFRPLFISVFSNFLIFSMKIITPSVLISPFDLYFSPIS